MEAHYIAKGGSLKKMLAELYGKVTGCAKGLGGSMHLIDLKAGVFAAVPIVGSTIPIGTGIAWANKLQKKKDLVTAFFGDGATEEGVFFESINAAGVLEIPMVISVWDDEYGISVSNKDNQKREV